MMREEDRVLLDYEYLKEKLAKDLKRPASTLVVTNEDPFQQTPGDKTKADWFADIWRRHGVPGMHLRRLHYRLVSQTKPVEMWDTSVYQNTEKCFAAFMKASRAARYLDLVPAEDMEERRNPDPLIYLPTEEGQDGEIAIEPTGPYVERGPKEMPPPPRLHLTPPIIAQPYHIEIWCEKTTINDILGPLGRRYGLNVITGAGDLSLTHCVQLVERAQRSDRPVRILYISDFDPKGSEMAVGVARKIEHRLYLKEIYDLDIQVRPVALTSEQCKQYDLPRIPIKDSDSAKNKFEEQHGEGATELDAMEALHPGELQRILEQEIARYHDDDLQSRVDDVAAGVEGQLTQINRAVDKQHRRQVKKLQAAYRKIRLIHEKQIKRWERQAKPVYVSMRNSLRDQQPDWAGINWPEPKDGDEDLSPLFDSTREYVEQMDVYKEYQRKPTTRRRKRPE
jgi:hypothetical protein